LSHNKKPTIKIEEDFGDRITIGIPARLHSGDAESTELSMYITGMQEISAYVSQLNPRCKPYSTGLSFFLDADSAHALGEWLMKHTRKAAYEVI
jgi:hypothetical protein